MNLEKDARRVFAGMALACALLVSPSAGARDVLPGHQVNSAAKPPQRPRQTKIHYYSGWDEPQALVQGGDGGKGSSGVPLRRVSNRPGWWRGTAPHGLREVVFHNGGGEWDNPGREPGKNYEVPDPAVHSVWVKNGHLYTLPPENIREHVVPAPAFAHDAKRKVTVILPPDYNPQERYPVLYLFDGQNVADRGAPHGGWRADKALGTQVQAGRTRPFIIVGIHTADNRMNDLTFVHDPKHGSGGGQEHLLRFLEHDLMPWVEHTYSTLPGIENRALGGSSLGGLATMYTLAKRPDLFRKGLVLSPTVHWANHAILREVEAAGAALAKSHIFLYEGGPEDDRADVLKELLAKKMQPGKNFFYSTDPHAGHNEGAWGNILPHGLATTFPSP